MKGKFDNGTNVTLIVPFNIGGQKDDFAFVKSEVVLINASTGSPTKTMLESLPSSSMYFSVLEMKGAGNDIFVGLVKACSKNENLQNVQVSLEKYFLDSAGPLSIGALDSIDFCEKMMENSRLKMDLQFSNRKLDKKISIKNLGLKAPDAEFKAWTNQNGLDQSNLLFQTRNLVNTNVTSNGTIVTSVMATFYKSEATDINFYVYECFRVDNGYVSPVVQSSKCKKFIDAMDNEQRRKNFDTFDRYFGAGFTVLHKLTIECACENLKYGETCTTFV